MKPGRARTVAVAAAAAAAVTAIKAARAINQSDWIEIRRDS